MFANANPRKRWRYFLTRAAEVATITQPPPARALPGERGWSPQSGVVWYWYDFVCPFSYVGQHRPEILRRHGLDVIELPLQIHPEVPRGGVEASPPTDAVMERLQVEAQEEGLEFRWPQRLPSSRLALAAAEWVREHEPSAFPVVQSALFRAHFLLGEDIESMSVIEAHAATAGVYVPFLRAALSDGSAYASLSRAERSARAMGVLGTPSWLGPQEP